MASQTRWRGAGKPQSVVKLSKEAAQEARILLLARRGWQANATFEDVVNAAVHAAYQKYDEAVAHAAQIAAGE